MFPDAGLITRGEIPVMRGYFEKEENDYYAVVEQLKEYLATFQVANPDALFVKVLFSVSTETTLQEFEETLESILSFFPHTVSFAYNYSFNSAKKFGVILVIWLKFNTKRGSKLWCTD